MTKPVAKFIVRNEDIRPIRSTKLSAGYDFIAPKSFTISSGDKVLFDTGVKVELEPGYVMLLFPRSSLGNNGLVLTNTVGVIDADYRDEIKAMLTNHNSFHSIHIDRGQKYMQGVIVKHGFAEEEEVTAERKGGVGSTGK